MTGLAWFRDGFFYSRYDAPEDGHDLSSRNDGHQVYYHRLGTAQADDRLVYEDKAHPQRFHTVQTTEDERFAILTVSERGQGKDGNALFFNDLSRQEAAFTPIVADVTNDRFQVIDNVDDNIPHLHQQERSQWTSRALRSDESRVAGKTWCRKRRIR